MSLFWPLHLAAAASLVVRVYPERVLASQGGPVTLRCQVSGNPPHYFYWSREDGRPISSSADRRRQGTSRTLPHIKVLLIFGLKHILHSFHLADIDTLITNNNWYTYRVGQSTCEYDSCSCVCAGAELYFPSVRPSDAGVYICTCRDQRSTNRSRAEIVVTSVYGLPAANSFLFPLVQLIATL